MMWAGKELDFNSWEGNYVLSRLMFLDLERVQTKLFEESVIYGMLIDSKKYYQGFFQLRYLQEDIAPE
jgi:hypothetical protein